MSLGLLSLGCGVSKRGRRSTPVPDCTRAERKMPVGQRHGRGTEPESTPASPIGLRRRPSDRARSGQSRRRCRPPSAAVVEAMAAGQPGLPLLPAMSSRR